MHINTCIYGCIWPYIPIYAPFWGPIGVRDFFTVHLHPGSWCTLHQADTIRTIMAVCCAVQHATPRSTAQHPCALQNNATQV